jgi:hypothetical protein
MAASSQRDELTTAEMRLVEQYVSVLDYVSRCAQAIDHGDWFYLYDKADTLAEKAGRLAELAREAYDAPRRPAPRRWGRRWPGRAVTTGPGGCCTHSTPKAVGGHEAAPARHP